MWPKCGSWVPLVDVTHSVLDVLLASVQPVLADKYFCLSSLKIVCFTGGGSVAQSSALLEDSAPSHGRVEIRACKVYS